MLALFDKYENITYNILFFYTGGNMKILKDFLKTTRTGCLLSLFVICVILITQAVGSVLFLPIYGVVEGVYQFFKGVGASIRF